MGESRGVKVFLFGGWGVKERGEEGEEERGGKEGKGRESYVSSDSIAVKDMIKGERDTEK